MNRETSIHSSHTLIVDDRARQRRWVIIGVVVALVAIAAVLFMVVSSGKDKKAAADAAAASGGQVPTVTVIVPGRSQVAGMITASGPLAAKRDQPVGIAGSGGRIVRVLVDAGSWVRSGQVLAVVDRSVQAQQAAQLAAQVQAAKADAALAQSNYDRAVALKDRGFVSKAEIDSKRATRDAAFAQVKVAQAQLAGTRAEIGRLNITAPTAGLIMARNVEIGQIVSPASGALFRLAEGGQMEMQAQLAQQDLAQVHIGMPATVTPVGSDRSFSGSVWQVAPMIDAQSRLGSVRIAVPYDAAMRPGGFAEARISGGTTAAPLLPQSAVLSDDRGNYVYVINAENKANVRDVVLGPVNGTQQAVTKGVKAGEAVVLEGLDRLREGRGVVIANDAPSTPKP